jgi:hypothetical protein
MSLAQIGIRQAMGKRTKKDQTPARRNVIEYLNIPQ